MFLSDGRELPTLHFHDGGSTGLLHALQRYVFLNRYNTSSMHICMEIHVYMHVHMCEDKRREREGGYEREEEGKGGGGGRGRVGRETVYIKGEYVHINFYVM